MPINSFSPILTFDRYKNQKSWAFFPYIISKITYQIEYSIITVDFLLIIILSHC